MQIDPSTTMASIDLTKSLEKAYKQIKNTGKLNKKESKRKRGINPIKIEIKK